MYDRVITSLVTRNIPLSRTHMLHSRLSRIWYDHYHNNSPLFAPVAHRTNRVALPSSSPRRNTLSLYAFATRPAGCERRDKHAGRRARRKNVSWKVSRWTLRPKKKDPSFPPRRPRRRFLTHNSYTIARREGERRTAWLRMQHARNVWRLPFRCLPWWEALFFETPRSVSPFPVEHVATVWEFFVIFHDN